MAGIGFTIKKILRKKTASSLFKGYGYAGIIGSGPWVLSVFALLVVNVLASSMYPESENSGTILLIVITWLIAGSQIFSGFTVLVFSRFTADTIFQDNLLHRVAPNLIGAIFLLTLSSGIFISIVNLIFVNNLTLGFQIILAINFIILSNIWFILTLIASLRKYRFILYAYAVGYFVIIVLTVWFAQWRLTEMLAGVAIGHAIIFFALLYAVLRNYSPELAPMYEFLQRKKIKLYLLFAGGFYYIGIWIDKIIFWLHPYTGDVIYAPFQACYVFDLPFFLAILTAIPGMAIFLVRLEADFVEHFHTFYDAVREGDTLKNIYNKKDEMVKSAKQGLFEVAKYQSIVTLIIGLWGKDILRFLGFEEALSHSVYHIFVVLVIGVGALVVFLSLMNIMFYLDFRRLAFRQITLMLILNVVLTLLSIQGGIAFYGYGFTLSLVITCISSSIILSRKIDNLEYYTFMNITN